MLTFRGISRQFYERVPFGNEIINATTVQFSNGLYIEINADQVSGRKKQAIQRTLKSIKIFQNRLWV